MYFVANLGPIEIGRVTVLKLNKPYLATVNAVEVKMAHGLGPNSPEYNYNQFFDDLDEAKDFAISFFPPRTHPYIMWTPYA